jgi:hypothetical protein
MEKELTPRVECANLGFNPGSERSSAGFLTPTSLASLPDFYSPEFFAGAGGDPLKLCLRYEHRTAGVKSHQRCWWLLSCG